MFKKKKKIKTKMDKYEIWASTGRANIVPGSNPGMIGILQTKEEYDQARAKREMEWSERIVCPMIQSKAKRPCVRKPLADLGTEVSNVPLDVETDISWIDTMV